LTAHGEGAGPGTDGGESSLFLGGFLKEVLLPCTGGRIFPQGIEAQQVDGFRLVIDGRWKVSGGKVREFRGRGGIMNPPIGRASRKQKLEEEKSRL